MTVAQVDPALARIASALNRLYLLYAGSDTDAPKLDALLCRLYEAQCEGRPLCSTDLVLERRFGTLPTVTARIATLVELGMLQAVIASDRRIRLLELTSKGAKLLAERDRLFYGETRST